MSFSSNMNLQKLYDLVGLKKVKGNAKALAVSSRQPIKMKTRIKTSPLFNTFIDVVTMVKRLNVAYEQTSGTALPGYTQSIGFLGTTRPSLGFVFGSQQADVRFEAARNGWLTTFSDFNQQFVSKY